MVILRIRDFLNKLFWDENLKKEREFFEITYIHRGVPGDLIRLNCKDITKINSDSFEYYEKDIEEEKMIPFHRIDKILNYKTGECIYRKIPKSERGG